MSNADDHRYMARALQLAAHGLYTTAPNPRVGCVLVRNGEIVGEGWHEYAGGPHAEIHALAQAGERARGATAYVTLEPCAHQGRTGPCARALIEAGVGRVVAAMVDPNPKVAGEGLRQLSEAGIVIEAGLCQAQAEALNPGFIRRMCQGRPFVRCKLAMTLDGRTALPSGESRWITDVPARQDVQRLRARSSAILTGVGTVLADDPSLTVRREDWPAEEGAPPRWPQPLRVVLDSALRMPPNARMLGLAGRTLVATGRHDPAARLALVEGGAEILELPHDAAGRVDLHALMDALARHEVNELLVEAGPTLNGALLEAGLVDELIVYVAPLLLGDGGRGLFHLPALQTMAQHVALDIVDVRAVGKDWRFTVRPG